jgi:hypothetical protein
MKPETEGKVKFGSWGLVCGAIIAITIGFVWGGWTTASTTQTISLDAVVASQAEVCVAQFMREPDHQEKLTEFQKISNWDRPKFIEKGGWDRMPGQKESGYRVTRACSDALVLLIPK